MPIHRFAGSALRNMRGRAEHSPGDFAAHATEEISREQQRRQQLKRDLALFGSLNPIGIAKWVFDPRPTAAGTLDDARRNGLIP